MCGEVPFVVRTRLKFMGTSQFGSNTFYSLGPLGRVSHGVAMSVCLCVLMCHRVQFFLERSSSHPPKFGVGCVCVRGGLGGCHVSCVTCHMSRVTCHVSRVTYHVSHVTCHIIFFFLPNPKKLVL